MMTVKIISEDEEEKDRDNADIRMPTIRTICGDDVYGNNNDECGIGDFSGGGSEGNPTTRGTMRTVWR